MRKGAGISGLSRHSATTSSYASLSSSLSATQLGQLETSLSSFRDALLSFAAAHRADIRKDPAFRHQFQKMCAAIGIDPLAGGNGRPAWWAESLGLGEWSAELALQVVDVCVSTRTRNGGILEMGELIARVEAMRRGDAAAAAALAPLPSSSPSTSGITPDDIKHALELLRPLHAGYTLYTLAGVTYVRSVPRELDTDQSMLLVLARDAKPRGMLTEGRAGWTGIRARTALDDAVMREGIAWVDEQGPERGVWLLAAVEFA